MGDIQEHPPSAICSAGGMQSLPTESTPTNPTGRRIDPAQSSVPCPMCGNGSRDIGPSSYVYAIGRIEPRFPRPSIEKEFAQATRNADTAGLTDRQALQRLLSDRERRYLVRQLCWTMTIEGIETYILTPRDPGDYDLLVEALRAAPSPLDLDLVIGVRGPIAAPEMCNGLMLPIVMFDQLYSFDRDKLIADIPRPENASEDYSAVGSEVLDRIMQIADNAGATDEHRAANYAAVRYSAVYAVTADAHARNYSLAAVDIRPSRLSGARNIMDVIFSYGNRVTDVVEKFFFRVDVTEEFPFLVTKMSPYYDR
jgi:hypothetical protein